MYITVEHATHFVEKNMQIKKMKAEGRTRKTWHSLSYTAIILASTVVINLIMMVYNINLSMCACVYMCICAPLQDPAPHVRRTHVPIWASASSSGRTTPVIAP